MYAWRKLTQEQREEVLSYRKQRHYPWHSPPILFRRGQFHLTGACYEHANHIGRNPPRMAVFSQRLLETLEQTQNIVLAWCVLPNHYHLLVKTADLKQLKKELGKLHGRTSHEWNLEEGAPGRTVWHRCADRGIRSERHYWSTINYIHNNPVHHGYVERWTDWPFSRAGAFIEQIGRDETLSIWREYPVLNYGKGWDDPEM
jgi:REP-associated tyrosine transposase